MISVSTRITLEQDQVPRNLGITLMGDDSFILSQAGIYGYFEASLRAKVNLSDLPNWDFLDCNVERKISPET